jgi:diacylglycerol kinase (ATP)
MSWIRSRLASVRFAFRGIVLLLAGEANARIHAAATVSAVCVAAWLEISPADWSLLVMAFALVWLAEGLNTAIELLADRISLAPDSAIGRAKDVAAGGVLLAAIGAAVIGFLVLGPPLFEKFGL